MGKATAPGDGPGGDGITARLRSQMQAQGLTSFRALAQRAQVSERQVRLLRRGLAPQLRWQTLERLAEALALDLPALLALAQGNTAAETGTKTSAAGTAAAGTTAAETAGAGTKRAGTKLAELRAECDRLQQQLHHQARELRQVFEQESLYQLEPWMKNWPRVVHAVQTDRPDLAAVKILPLVRPLEQLLQSWGVTAIGAVGDRLPYDPQQHQLLQGQIEPGGEITVTRPGYRQGDRLLHRAEVQAP